MATRLLINGQNPVLGDDLDVKVIISQVLTGVTYMKAWLTLKTVKTDPDPVTPGPSGLQVVITDGFSGTATVTFTFSVTKAATALLKAGVTYYFDVQLKDTAEKITTPIHDGIAIFDEGVTTASS